jgi:hypothetical protein
MAAVRTQRTAGDIRETRRASSGDELTLSHLPESTAERASPSAPEVKVSRVFQRDRRLLAVRFVRCNARAWQLSELKRRQTDDS